MIRTRIFIIFILTIAIGCNDDNSSKLTQQNGQMDFEDSSLDSIHLDLRDQFKSPSFVDTLMYVNGKSEMINGLKCSVQYVVLADSGNRDSVVLVSIDSTFSITPKQRIPLMHYNFYKTEKNIEITVLQKLSLYFSDIEDKNKDGYLDIVVMTEQAQNCYFDVFIFNPKTRLFEFSKIFSGFESFYDKKLRRVSSSYHAGASFHINRFINLDKDRKTIAFTERITMDRDSFTYEKLIGKKVVEKKRKVISNQPHEYFDFEKWLERGVSEGD